MKHQRRQDQAIRKLIEDEVHFHNLAARIKNAPARFLKEHPEIMEGHGGQDDPIDSWQECENEQDGRPAESSY